VNYRWHLPSFWMLSSVDFVIDVSGQPNGPIFKDQGVEETSLITGYRNITEERSGSLKS